MFRWIGVCGLAFVVSACGGSGAATSQGGSAASPILIGAPISETGADSHEGTLTKDGFQLWADYVNQHGGIDIKGTKHPVKLISYDDQSNPQTSAQLVQRLVTQDRVNLLFAPYGSPATFAAEGIAARYKTLMCDHNGASDKVFEQKNPYLFGVVSLTSTYGASTLGWLDTVQPKPQSIAILSADDLFSKGVADSVKAAAEQQGLRVVYYQTYPPNTTDLSAPLSAMRPLQPDIIVGTSHLADGIVLMRQASQFGVKPKLFVLTTGPAIPDFQTTLGPLANGVLSPVQWAAGVNYTDPVFGSAADYTKLFHDRFGFDPPFEAADASACGVVFQQAVQKAGTVDTEAVRAALTQLDVTTFLGPIRFAPSGANVAKPMVLVQVLDGKVLPVWPAKAAATKLVYPAVH